MPRAQCQVDPEAGRPDRPVIRWPADMGRRDRQGKDATTGDKSQGGGDQGHP